MCLELRGEARRWRGARLEHVLRHVVVGAKFLLRPELQRPGGLAEDVLLGFQRHRAVGQGAAAQATAHHDVDVTVVEAEQSEAVVGDLLIDPRRAAPQGKEVNPDLKITQAMSACSIRV